MNFYLAAASTEIERAERVILAMCALGGVCTYDWTRVMRANRPDHELTDEVLLPELRNDIYEGVVRAKLFVVLAPTSHSTGAYVELGAAAVMQKVGSLFVHVVGATPHAWCRAFAEIRHYDDANFLGWFSATMKAGRR